MEKNFKETAEKASVMDRVKFVDLPREKRPISYIHFPIFYLTL